MTCPIKHSGIRGSRAQKTSLRTTYILDTNVCIHFFKANPKVVARIKKVDLSSIAVTTSVLAELYFGAFHSKQVSKNLERIDEFIQLIQVIPDSEASAKIFGDIKAKLFTAGKPIDDFDIHIASIALLNNCVLVTNNQSHFKRVPNLNLEDWL